MFQVEVNINVFVHLCQVEVNLNACVHLCQVEVNTMSSDEGVKITMGNTSKKKTNLFRPYHKRSNHYRENISIFNI